MQTWTCLLNGVGLSKATAFGSYMSILFKPLGVLIGLLRTEQKPAFEIETTGKKLRFEFCRLQAVWSWASHSVLLRLNILIFATGGRGGSRVLHLLRTYYMPDIVFVIAGIPPNKAQGKGLDTVAYVEGADHRKQE